MQIKKNKTELPVIEFEIINVKMVIKILLIQNAIHP